MEKRKRIVPVWGKCFINSLGFVRNAGRRRAGFHAANEPLTTMSALEIKNLCVSIQDKPILKDFSLTLPKGEVHALMGPNGTGKSTLAKALAGHPDYTVTAGEVLLDGQNLLEIPPEGRAQIAEKNT